MTTVRVGISANFFHADPQRPVFRHKTLQYLEERMALALWHAGAVPLLLPDLKHEQGLSAMIDAVDGLVLAGGADVSPTSYGETPLRDTWRGDAVRDAYECELVRIARARGVPVLGVCRGIQLLNVALGGTLWQDIATQIPGASVHLHDDYDRHSHDIVWNEDSSLARLYPEQRRGGTISIHHQAIKALGRGLRVEAHGADDEVIEAIRFEGRNYVFGVQWHPEFHPPGAPHLLDCTPILDEFLTAARRRRW